MENDFITKEGENNGKTYYIARIPRPNWKAR